MFYGWETAMILDASGLTPRDYYDRLKGIWAADTCAPRMRESWTTDCLPPPSVSASSTEQKQPMRRICLRKRMKQCTGQNRAASTHIRRYMRNAQKPLIWLIEEFSGTACL